MADLRGDIALLHRRAGFGATAAELDASVARGYDATVDALVAGLSPTAPDPGGDALAPPVVPGYQPPAGRTPEARAAARARAQADRRGLGELQRWWFDRMIATSTPLREKLVLLWSGHFATAYGKVRRAALMHGQNQLFRTLGAGPFDALVQAVAKDPAMMVWLDTRTNVAGRPNENFARELMELFTLGIGSYGQADVRDAARAFTGWTFAPGTGAFRVLDRRHDHGRKTVLGTTGDLGGEDVVSLLCRHPASRRFVAAKLFSHLAHPVSPTDPVVDDLVRAYGPTLDVTALVRAIFLHPTFRSDATRTGLVKQPIELVVGTARALGLDAAGQPKGAPSGAGPTSRPTPGAAGRAYLLPLLASSLSQVAFEPPNVGGWPQNGYWINTATAAARWRAANVLARRADLGVVESAAPDQRVAAVTRLLSLPALSSRTAATLQPLVGDPVQLVAVALTAPEHVLS